MSGFEITLDRKHVTEDGTPLEVWVASVEAEAYDDKCGRTAGAALRRLGDEFDVEFGAKPRGNWQDREEDRHV